MVMSDSTLNNRLKDFVESEMRSSSMDIGGITPIYVYRMWNGDIALDDIKSAMAEIIFPGR